MFRKYDKEMLDSELTYFLRSKPIFENSPV